MKVNLVLVWAESISVSPVASPSQIWCSDGFCRMTLHLINGENFHLNLSWYFYPRLPVCFGKQSQIAELQQKVSTRQLES